MTYSDIVLCITKSKLTQSEMVTILKLLSNELQMATISETARRDNKTPPGVRKSSKYEKIEIGGQLMAINKSI